LIVVPEEAETVRLIFQRYLELGSVRDLVEDLDNRRIRTRRQTLSDDKIQGGIRFGVGSLSHLLRNRFYRGEVVYRGKIYMGEHTPIVDRKLFDAVQAKLTANTNVRELKLKSSPSILTGRIFDDRGNRMSPTHTNKKGARYRYYVSHAILQKLNKAAGSISRINAADIETLVMKVVRSQLAPETDPADSQCPASAARAYEGRINRTGQRVQSDLATEQACPGDKYHDHQ
jgi:site-specific DNA recombinase